jgi:hypothetical protein
MAMRHDWWTTECAVTIVAVATLLALVAGIAYMSRQNAARAKAAHEGFDSSMTPDATDILCQSNPLMCPNGLLSVEKLNVQQRLVVGQTNDANTTSDMWGFNHGVSSYNPKSERWTHFPWKDGNNYIRGDTIVNGHVEVKQDGVGGDGELHADTALCVGPDSNRWCLRPSHDGQSLDISRNGATAGPNAGTYRLTQDGNIWINRALDGVTSTGWVAEGIAGARSAPKT